MGPSSWVDSRDDTYNHDVRKALAALLAFCLVAPGPAAAAFVVDAPAAATSGAAAAPAAISSLGASASLGPAPAPIAPSAALRPLSAAALTAPIAAPAAAAAPVPLAATAAQALAFVASDPATTAPAPPAAVTAAAVEPAARARVASGVSALAPLAAAPRTAALALDAFFDRSARSAPAAEPTPLSASAGAASLAPAARPAPAAGADDRVVPEARRAAPRGVARFTGSALRVFAAASPLLPALALLAVTGNAAPVLLGALAAGAAIWGLRSSAARIENPSVRGVVQTSAGIGIGVLAGAAAYALARGGDAVAVAAATTIGLAAAASVARAFAPLKALFADKRAEPVFLGARMQGGSAELNLAPADFGRLFLISGVLEKGLGEKEMYSLLTDSMERLVYLRRSGEFVELVARALPQRAALGSPLAYAAAQVASDSVIGKARVRAADRATGTVGVDASEFFVEDPFQLARQLEARYGGLYAVDGDTSRVDSVKAYPRNAELSGRLVLYQRERPDEDANSAVPDQRRLPLSVRLSFLALPEPGFTPRRADPRIGHFSTIFQDWTRPADGVDTSLIHRWRLEKEDPGAAASKVKQPIVFWIDPSVPKEFRGAVARGVLDWNKAFSRIGLIDAVAVREAPEDGSFDAADARHTVISWRLDPDARYAMGPSRADPRTGEIYQANVTISGQHLLAALDMNHKDLTQADFDDRDEARTAARCTGGSCGHAAHAAERAATALGVIEARSGRMSDEERRRFAEDYITDLVVHEIGHTLGLRHNFLGRALRSLDEVEGGVQPQTSSVMDYLAPNIARPGKTQTNVWNVGIGPYDEWAIEYAYKPLDGLAPQEQAAELERIASRAGAPGLEYATDEDLVEKDPDSRPWASGRDAIAYARAQAEIAREVWATLEKPEHAADAYDLYVAAWRMLRGAERHASTAVGGVSYRRGLPAQPISGARQREALALLNAQIFSDEPFKISAVLRGRLVSPQKPTLADPFPEPFQIPHETMVLWLRQDTLQRLLSAEVLDRVAENSRLVGKKDGAMTLDELIDRVDRMVWSELFSTSKRKGRGISAMRRQLQEYHLNLLLETAYVPTEDEQVEVSAALRVHLDGLRARLKRQLRVPGWDAPTRRHLKQQLSKLEAALSHYEP